MANSNGMVQISAAELENLRKLAARATSDTGVIRCYHHKAGEKYTGKSDGKTYEGKGTLSVAGINGTHPVSLYASQWTKLLSNQQVILKYIADNQNGLSYRSDDERDAVAAYVEANLK